MYKTVTHNIVEEHYGHPQQALEFVGYGAVQPMDPLPMYAMTEGTMVFRMDSRSLWAKYAWGLLNYGISMNAGLPVMEQVEARMFKNARALGDFITPYYGITAGNRLSDLLSNIGQVGIDLVKATKEGEDIAKLNAMWTDLIATLAGFMVELNPSYWPDILITEYFTNLVGFWVAEIQARASNDAAADEAAIDSLNKLVVMGIANSVPTHKASSLADIFSRGIIAQFPSLFATQ